MRRPRSKLEVSTFPFLAVLLCVMGSLLLLLFIMDRRAKIAAQYRVAEELQARKARSKAEEDARRAEWEKAKSMLHQSLLEQQAKLLAEAKGLQQNLSESDKNLAIVQTQHVDLAAKVKSEADKIGAIYLEIESRRAGLKDAAKKETMTKAELIDAAKELAELEQALRQLKALRERDKATYSVVPYRGKRGDTRLPIYVECLRDGLVFHPEKKSMQGNAFTPFSLRLEVERRFGTLSLQQPIEKGRVLSDQEKGPYVLFLVRPDGIGNYDKAQAALKGFQLDFGYELVDAGWVLDFSSDPFANSVRQPILAKPVDTRPLDPPSLPLIFGGGNVKGSGRADQGPPLVPFPPLSGSGVAGGPGTNRPGLGAAGGGNSAGGGNAGAGNPSEGDLPSKAPAFVPIGKLPPIFPGLGVVEGAPGRGGNQPGVGVPNPGNVNQSGGGAPNPGTVKQFDSGAPNSGNANLNAGSPSIGPVTAPIPGNSVASQNLPNQSPGSPANSGGTGGFPANGGGTPGAGGTPANSGGTPGAGGSPGESPGPLGGIRPLPGYGRDTDKKPAPASPLSKLLGNKDFLITVDCHADYVTVLPGGYTYRWNTSNLKETNDAFVQTVTNLIARRQASVRAGEPPYRPVICFQVSSEGLKTYYHAWPLLDRLNVTMTRENVAP